MDKNLNKIKTNVYDVYDVCGLLISNFKIESESKEYDACRFDLNGFKIVSRNAKRTPKKVGQFVTFWKRNSSGIIEPLNETDSIDFYIITIQTENRMGQFVFPKSLLIRKGIISTNEKEGKRGFRVYTSWDNVKSKQAENTQKWQQSYFYEIGKETDFEKVNKLFSQNDISNIIKI